MTWTKLGQEYNDELAVLRLSDAAYRTHTEAIGWLYRVEEMSLLIAKHLVRRFASTVDPDAAIAELVTAGCWGDAGGSWQVVHHAEVVRQSIVAQQKKRRRDTHAQRAARSRVSADVSADVAPRQSVSQTASHLGRRPGS